MPAPMIAPTPRRRQVPGGERPLEMPVARLVHARLELLDRLRPEELVQQRTPPSAATRSQESNGRRMRPGTSRSEEIASTPSRALPWRSSEQGEEARGARPVVVVDERVPDVQHLAGRDARAPDGLVEDPAVGLAHAHQGRHDHVVERVPDAEPLEEGRQARVPVRHDDELDAARPKGGEDLAGPRGTAPSEAPRGKCETRCARSDSGISPPPTRAKTAATNRRQNPASPSGPLQRSSPRARATSTSRQVA